MYEYFRSNELLAERSFINDEFGRTTVELFIERLIDRYIHMYSNFDFDKEAFFQFTSQLRKKFQRQTYNQYFGSDSDAHIRGK